jgi:alpha-tubulin suppressor-like RCC1 family protein
MNLLLIDSEIPGLDIFMKSCNSKTKFVVYNSKLVTFQMLDKKIASLNITRYNNLGFVFVNEYDIGKLFVENTPFVSYNQDAILDNMSTSYITYLIRKYQIKTVDFLACSLLSEPIWKQYFDYMMIKNNVKVRASNDSTGNLSSGGDWILESTGENVEKIYFNSNIQYWNYLLDTQASSRSTFVISLDNSNNLYACGGNASGQLGLGNNISINSFQIVSNFSPNILNKKVLSVVSGEAFSLLITNEAVDNLYSCGNNGSGQLGSGNTVPRNTFQRVTSGISGKKIVSISSGSSHSLLLTNDANNNLYSCGLNSSGQLGLGDTLNKLTFLNVLSGISGKKINFINCGNNYSFLMTNDSSNNLYSCGDNSSGQLGLGDIIHRTSFNNVVSGISGKKILSASGGGGQSLILTNDISNNLYGCGLNSSGQLGSGVYPSYILTNNTTTISGQGYGNGTYIASASSTGGGTTASRAFDADTVNSYWRSGGGYDSNGIYTGSISTTTTSGSILGQWLQIQLPVSTSIKLGGFTLSTRSNNIMKPKAVTILGSNNTSNPWNIIYDTSNVGLFPPDQVTVYLNTLPVDAYRFYRIVVSEIIGNAGYTEISNWVLYEQSRNFQNISTTAINKKYINVSAGGSHSLLLTNDTSNNLYVTGVNSSGQFGDGTNVNSLSFKQSSNTILNKYYNNISSGFNYSLVTTSDPINNLYVTGGNDDGQLDLSSNTNINILRNTIINISNKKVLLNNLINRNTPTTNTFLNFTYGTNNTTYYSTSQDNNNNIISIAHIFIPDPLFPTLFGTIGDAYSISPIGTTFDSVISFEISFLYLSNVYYQYNINSELLKMSSNSTQLPYYTYNGSTVTIFTNNLFEYLVLTTPPTKTGAQFSNLKQLVINSVDSPLILPNTRLNCSFLNTPSIVADISGWDVSSSITMSSMFRDSSFNNELFTWKPKSVTDMSYMFYGANNFNKKLSYNPSQQTWDVSAVTNMSYIFNTASVFNNSQIDMSGTEPMNWNLNPNVNLTNDVSYSLLTAANAQTLTPDLLVYLNVGIVSTTELTTNSTSQYVMNFYNEDEAIGISNETITGTRNTMFGSRYNIAGDALWSVKINVLTTSSSPGPNQGSMSSDLSRNIIMTGRWYNNTDPGSCRFYDSNGVLNTSLTLPWGGSVDSSQNSFMVKYNTNGFSEWRNRICFDSSFSSHKINNTCCDISGNIYSTGQFNGRALFQNSSLATWVDISSDGNFSSNKPDGFLAKYNRDGSGVWFAKMTSNNSEEAYQTIVDRANNIYSIGYHDVSGTQIYSGALNGFGTLSNTIPYTGTWFCKYGPDGNVLWSTDFYGTIFPSMLGYALSYDVYVGGYYSGTSPTFRNSNNSIFTTLTDISDANAYVAKYTSDGFGSWTSRISTNSNPLYTNITGICSEKQFLDINYPQQGLKFAIYNGYFDNRSEQFGFFYSNYPYASGVTSNLTGLSSSTNGKYVVGEYRSVCWWGFFKAKKTGIYTFTTISDNASYLMINGNIVVDNGGTHGTLTKTGTCSLIAGTDYYIQIFYGNLTGGQAFGAGYTEPGGTFISDATGLNTYFVSSENYIGMYDNWVNQNSYTFNNITIINQNENYFNINTTGADPLINMTGRPAVNPYIYKYIHIKYRIMSISSGSTPYFMEIFYGNSSYPLSESRKVIYTYPTPISNILGSWQNAIIDMTNQTNWYTDNWSVWRLDPLYDGIANIQFEYFYVSDSPTLSLNESGNNVYVTGFSQGNVTNIYNSSFLYNTKNVLGYPNINNSLFKTYTSNNSFEKSYIIKYNSNGQCDWSILLDGGLNVRTNTIRIDKTGYVYVFGYFGKSITIRDKNNNVCKEYIINQDTYDTFIVVYSSDGLYQWSTRQQSNQDDFVMSYGPSNTNPYTGLSLAMS